ncbi:MAG: ABC transporter ATP-binding protein [Waddliaceae bacterium]|nr:ABC transporter ATP-binding protein [Waddliaceae bacterium]
MIEVKNLKKSFGSFQVLNGLTLSVKKAETVVILGRSGCGKSVLLKHIIGILRPDAGEVWVNGEKVSHMKEKQLYQAVRNMGMLFQGAALFDSMTVEENTAFYLNQHGHPETGKPLPKSEIRDRVAESLAMVGLENTQKKMPSDLSGGMRKRAGLARLIVYRPTILLYDEPTTGLDPVTAMQINQLIRKTQEELGATSIVVTHDICSALTVSDRLALHADGHIRHIAEKEEFVQSDDPLIRDFFDQAQPAK